MVNCELFFRHEIHITPYTQQQIIRRQLMFFLARLHMYYIILYGYCMEEADHDLEMILEPKAVNKCISLVELVCRLK